MPEASYAAIVQRLAQILVKLNNGEKLDPQRLAEEFSVTLRTIQRDLHQRFAYLPLQPEGRCYFLQSSFLGKLCTRDIERFASLAGVRQLFLSLSDEFLRDIFDERMQSAFLLKGHDYEDLRGREGLSKQLEQAIVELQRIDFHYEKESGSKAYSAAEPYKLLNQKGIWYLAARDADRLKSFTFTRISGLRLLDGNFEHDVTLDQQLAQEEGIRFSEAPKEVMLKVAQEVAGYFERRKLIANQVIEKELEDSGLIVSAHVGHPNQIVPIVRYWIPHLHIISPELLQAELKAALKAYVNH